MSYAQSTAIRVAIEELMRGTIGVVRMVPMNLFEEGVFEGQPVPAKQVKALDQRFGHRFDVVVGAMVPHASTPLSIKSPARRARVNVEIRITTRLKTTPQNAERKSVRARIEGDCQTAIAALCYPGNLTFTSDNEPTGIISGMLSGPDEPGSFPAWEPVSEDWSQHLYTSRIVGSAILQIEQAVA